MCNESTEEPSLGVLSLVTNQREGAKMCHYGRESIARMLKGHEMMAVARCSGVCVQEVLQCRKHQEKEEEEEEGG